MPDVAWAISDFLETSAALVFFYMAVEHRQVAQQRGDAAFLLEREKERERETD